MTNPGSAQQLIQTINIKNIQTNFSPFPRNIAFLHQKPLQSHLYMRSRHSSSYNLKPQDTGRNLQQSPRSNQLRFQTGGGSSDHNEQRMRELKQRGLMKFILRKMQRLIPLTTPRVPVFQEWEGLEEEDCRDGEMDNRSFDEKVFAMYPIYQVFCFIRAITLLIFLWAASVGIAFEDNVLGFGVLILMLVMVVDLLSKAWLAGNHKTLRKCLKQSKIKEVGCPVLVGIGCILMLGLNMIDNNKKIWLLASMGMILPFIAPNLFAYFEIVKIFAERKKLIKQMRIVELFCVLFLLAHIFGLILFSATKIKPQSSQSWTQMDSLHLSDKPWWVQYIYSVYWAMTTITTVGYGDITPQNYVQIIVVMVIQICGASFFGYMMSVIGDIVDQKNAKNEEYDNYQQTITKLRDHYNLTSQLTQTMKSDIKDKYNKQKSTPLRKAEEEQFLDYLDPLVRKQFIHQTNIRIIKKSIFFLTYFTVHFQNQIALKLIRAIYKKDDGLLTIDTESKQRKLIIINNGRINLFIQKRHNNVSCQKLVKTIQTYEGKPTLNVYGYSAMIMDRNIALFARAEALTSAYELLASDVLEIISKNMIDYETFHEMRQKMLISPIKQSIQAPILNDSTFHYTPNIFILSKKQNKKFYQTRVKRQRDQRRKKLELIDVVSIINFKRKLSIQPIEQRAQKYRSLFQKKSHTEFQSLMSIQQLSQNQPTEQITAPIQRHSNELCLDQIKIFDRFMRSHNINNIAAKYELSCRNGSYRKRILSAKLMHS